MKKYCFKVDKLIRDKIPEIVRVNGLGILTRSMDKDEYLIRLKDKLFEESEEVRKAVTQQELREELADLLEVITSIARENHLEFDSILQKADEKRSSNGSFDERLYGDTIEVPEDHSRLQYYLNNFQLLTTSD